MATENCHNMVSNLPLLFAGGYPTSLTKITEYQLEKLIPFMVQCSLGNVQNHNDAEYSEPEWWPETVPFSIPLRRPVYVTDWHNTLKSIVLICYDFHNSTFLLRFCEQLASYQPESLRFINNINNTTSLYERISGKLLVTFRNENMLYDQTPVDQTSEIVEGMGDTVDTVIYLCDNCDAELYSKEAYEKHVQSCQIDDDVIFCGEEFLTNPIAPRIREQTIFLQNFSLVNPKMLFPNRLKTPMKKTIELLASSAKRRNSQCSQILSGSDVDFSSPAGQQLLKLSKTRLARSYGREQVESYERFCCESPTADDSKNTWVKRNKYRRQPVTYRRPQDHTYRWYTFPRRQHSQNWCRQAFLNLNITELKMCKPVTVELTRLSNSDIEAFNSKRQYEEMMTNEDITEPAHIDESAIDDVIDLCCSDGDSDDESTSENVHSNHHYNGNVSQTAITPAATLSPSSFIDPLQLPSEMYPETSAQSTMSIVNSDINSQYQHHDTYQSFLNGAQGSIVTRIDKMTEHTDISIESLPAAASQTHMSIDLTL